MDARRADGFSWLHRGQGGEQPQANPGRAEVKASHLHSGSRTRGSLSSAHSRWGTGDGAEEDRVTGHSKTLHRQSKWKVSQKKREEIVGLVQEKHMRVTRHMEHGTS